MALVLRRLNVHEKITARKRRKKGKRQALTRVLAPLQPVISQNLSRVGAGQFRNRLGQIVGRKTVIVNAATGTAISEVRSRRAAIDRISPSAAARAGVAPVEDLVRVLGEIRSRRGLRPNPQTLTPQTDLEPLYEHLGIAQNRVVGQLAGTRQPVYDLIDFERQGRVVTLTKTSGAPNQAAFFQFQVPEDFSMRLHAINVSQMSAVGSTLMQVQTGWIGASQAVNYTRLSVDATKIPQPIFGCAIEKVIDEYTREQPLDIPQGGVISINSGLDFDAAEFIQVTIQYELKPSFRQISTNPNDWIVT